ncbi:MAG: PTS sugar transporter subunit IIA, partial [Deltaproteobacteria bacterium]|nr:PTS sugar transporter subunit IIA [Deltaproteobacteria bacterium]
MKITDYLTPALVVAELEMQAKDEALQFLAGRVAEVFPALEESEVLAVLKDREALGSTGIGGGIAIPHGKLGGLEKVIVLFARSSQGVEFAAVDGKPVHLIFLLLAPESAAGTHLKILARISRMLKQQEFCDKLLEKSEADG